MYQFLRMISNFYHCSSQIVLIAGSYSFGIPLRLGSKVSCTNSYVLFQIFITVARSYSFDSWQLQFWDIIVIIPTYDFKFLSLQLAAIVLIAGSYSFGISPVSKVSCTDSYIVSSIFITVAHSYSFDSWQLQFWDIILISLEV